MTYLKEVDLEKLGLVEELEVQKTIKLMQNEHEKTLKKVLDDLHNRGICDELIPKSSLRKALIEARIEELNGMRVDSPHLLQYVVERIVQLKQTVEGLK